MKIAVISDSHGKKNLIDDIFKNYKFDALIHLGDGDDDLGLYSNLSNVYVVRGNCDFGSANAHELMLQFGGVCFFVTHGHKYMVKFSRAILASEAAKMGAQVALYGHTHKFCDEYIDNVRLINPGALKNKQFIMLDVSDGQIKINSIFL